MLMIFYDTTSSSSVDSASYTLDKPCRWMVYMWHKAWSAGCPIYIVKVQVKRNVLSGFGSATAFCQSLTECIYRWSH